MTLVFSTKFGNLSLCEVTTESVESMVGCSRSASDRELTCEVQKMRRKNGYTNRNVTALDHGRLHTILLDIPVVTASLRLNQVSLLEAWLKDPPTVFNPRHDYDTNLWYEDINPHVFSNRLAMVLNTHIQAALNITILVGGDGTSAQERDWQWENSTGIWTEAAGTSYHINKTWFRFYLASTVVLALCAVANIVLRCSISTPDLLTSVSALTRNSLFFDVPTPASGMCDAERSRLLKDEWVMVQDVLPDESVGRIAFSNALGQHSLRKDRAYM